MRQSTAVLVYVARCEGSKTEYLLLLRRPLPALGVDAFWQGVTGGLEDDESCEQAARRELREETGITPDSMRDIGFSYSFPIQEEWKSHYPSGATEINEHAFLAAVSGDARPQLSSEHSEWKWCPIEQAVALLRYPNNVEALLRCDELLTGHQALILAPPNPAWKQEFEALREVLLAALSPRVTAVHHVGSTAIPGLIAKPILDIDVEIPSYSCFGAVRDGLDRLGYEYRGKQGIKDRHAFRQQDLAVPRVSPCGEWTVHHLYVCPSFSTELEKHLLFRDSLRKHPESRQEYADLKRAIAAESRNDRKVYATLKETRAAAFVERVIRKAGG